MRNAMLLLVLAAVASGVGCRRTKANMSRGGIELVYRPVGAPLSAAQLEDVRDRLSRRLEAAKVPHVVGVDQGSVRVDMPAGASSERVAALRDFLGRRFRLELCEVDEDWMVSLDRGRLPEGLSGRDGGGPTVDLQAATREVAEAAAKALAPSLPAGERILFQAPRAQGEQWQVLVVKPAAVKNEDIASAEVAMDGERPTVAFQLRKEAVAPFEQLTTRILRRRLAMVLDDAVLMAPLVQSRISGQAQITLGLGRTPQEMLQEAQSLALVLRSGTALPVALELVEERTVAPAR